MTIAQMHKKAVVVIETRDAADADVGCVIYCAGTVNGVRWWFEKRVDGRVVHRRSTIVLATARQWLDTMDEACNEGELTAVVFNHPAIKQLREES